MSASVSVSDGASSLPLTVVEGELDGFRTLRVSESGELLAVVALRGATLLSWRRPLGGETLELIDGYRSGAELRAQNGVRMGIMAPFVNRIARARYIFDGMGHDLRPGAGEHDRLVYHGLMRERDFELSSVEQVSDGQVSDEPLEARAAVTMTLVNRELRPGTFAGYPFAVDVTVSYTFTRQSIAVRVTGTNVGTVAAPFASGWHPYFLLGGDPVDALELQIPARTRVIADEALIPLPGGAALAELRAASDGVDFSASTVVGDAVLDVCFTDLALGGDGRAHTIVRNVGRGIALDVWQSRGAMHVFTGDTLARDRRASLALEPVEVLTDAFNRPDAADAIRLEPGRSRSFEFGVTVEATAG